MTRKKAPKVAHLDRHNIYLDRRAWGEFKLAAYRENTTVSELLAGLLERYLQEPEDILIPHFQPRQADDRNPRSPCTAYLPFGLWARVEEFAGEAFSVSSLAGALISRYLEEVSPAPKPAKERVREEDRPQPAQPAAPERYMKVGNRTLDLGENPTVIDLTPPKKQRTAED